MFDLPGLDGVEEMVINREVVEGRAKPLHIYADRRGDVGTGDVIPTGSGRPPPDARRLDGRAKPGQP